MHVAIIIDCDFWTFFSASVSAPLSYINLVLCTYAIHRKAYKVEGNIYITQDMVRAILVLPGCSCTISFAIQANIQMQSNVYVPCTQIH